MATISAFLALCAADLLAFSALIFVFFPPSPYGAQAAVLRRCFAWWIYEPIYSFLFLRRKFGARERGSASVTLEILLTRGRRKAPNDAKWDVRGGKGSVYNADKCNVLAGKGTVSAAKTNAIYSTAKVRYRTKTKEQYSAHTMEQYSKRTDQHAG